MLDDAKHLRNFMIIRYEDFIQDVFSFTEKVLRKAGLSALHKKGIDIQKNTNEKYFEQWQLELSSGNHFDDQTFKTLEQLDLEIRPFGYAIFNPE